MLECSKFPVRILFYLRISPLNYLLAAQHIQQTSEIRDKMKEEVDLLQQEKRTITTEDFSVSSKFTC